MMIPQVAAGSVVLRDLPPHSTAAGVPAKVLGVATEKRPSEVVDQNLKHVLFDKNNGNGAASVLNKNRRGLGRDAEAAAARGKSAAISFRARRARSKL